jgi:hypothetical protein
MLITIDVVTLLILILGGSIFVFSMIAWIFIFCTAIEDYQVLGRGESRHEEKDEPYNISRLIQ